jgi:hypothetical protein
MGWPRREQQVPPSETPDLRALAKLWAEEMEESRKRAYHLGNQHRWEYVTVAVLGVIAGAVAGATGLAHSTPLVTGIAGFVASGLAALAVPLNAKNLARFHYSQAGRYDVIGRRFKVLAVGRCEPMKADILALVDELARVKDDKVEESAN